MITAISPSRTCPRSRSAVLWVEQIKTQLPELPEARGQRFVAEFGLTVKEANLLTSEKSLADYFEKAVSLSKSPAKEINNWISRRIPALRQRPGPRSRPPASPAGAPG